MMEIDRNFECKNCNSDNVKYNLIIHQDFSITYPKQAFCYECLDDVEIQETKQSLRDFENSLIINLGGK